jgi:plastocyanin
MKASSRRARFAVAAVGVVAIGALGVAGFALAGAVGITLTAKGPEPATATVALGDTLMFTNSDTAAHVVASKPLHWVTTSIPPGGTYTYVATKSGTWGYQAGDSKGEHKVQGSFVVTKLGTLSLKSTATSINYGRSIVLSGVTSLPTFPVVIQVQSGNGWSPLQNPITPAPDGAFSLKVSPVTHSVYRATVLDGELQSASQTVDVKPILTLRSSTRRTATGSTFRLTAHISPRSAAKRLKIQLFNREKKKWGLVGDGRVGSTGSVVVPFEARQGYMRLRAGASGLAKGLAQTFSKQVVVVGVGAPPKKHGKGAHKTTTTTKG